MTVTKPDREPSLLERAAKVYDFNAHARSRNIVLPAAPVAPDASAVETSVTEPRPDTAARQDSVAALDHTDATFLAIPEELRAPVGDEFADDVYYPEDADDTVRIDRGMLAANGMIVPGAPVGPLAEEFRLIKRQLLIASTRIAESDSADKARMILVCSAQADEGKTFCAINLALSMAAEKDVEILLVDADFSKPDILERLGLPQGPGLLDALTGAIANVEDCILDTDVPQLSVLPAGAPGS